MFFDNKYTKWYYAIISRSLARKPNINAYYEKHHIIPKCLNGTDDISNLVKLTAREHYICHMLLTKMTDQAGVKYAFHNMCHCKNPNQQRIYKINSKIYDYAKRLNSELAKQRMKGKSYNIGKKLYHDPITRDMKFFSTDEEVPPNYIKGGTKEKRNIGAKNKGKKYYYNPITKHVIAINPTDAPPIGYVMGNCNANTTKYSRMNEREYYFNEQGKEKRFLETDKIPEGWKKGRCIMWITNGQANKRINSIKDEIPEGWKKGKTIATGQFYASKPIQTPFGTFDHPYRFCEQFNCNISFFDNLNCRLRPKSLNPVFVEELTKINYNFKLTKHNNGFYFIDDPHCMNQYTLKIKEVVNES